MNYYKKLGQLRSRCSGGVMWERESVWPAGCVWCAVSEDSRPPRCPAACAGNRWAAVTAEPGCSPAPDPAEHCCPPTETSDTAHPPTPERETTFRNTYRTTLVYYDITIWIKAVRYDDMYRIDEIKSLSFHIMFYHLFRGVEKYIVSGKTFSSFEWLIFIRSPPRDVTRDRTTTKPGARY